MKYLKVFTDFIDELEEYGDAERGRLFTAMLEYARTGTEPGFRGNERFIWKSVKASIDRERDTYDRMAERARNVASKRAASSETRHRNDIVRHRNDIVQENNDIVQDKDKEKKYTPLTPQGDARFSEFWKAYPRKVGKATAEKAWAKLKVTDELHSTILAALEKHKVSDQWTKDGGQYIPHPSTWLNQRRWEDELEAAQPEEPVRQINWVDGW